MDFGLSVLTAFSIGFLGSTHCIAMCGGIVGMLNITPEQAATGTHYPQGSQERKSENSPSAATGMARSLTRHLTYNAGRITSYVAVGFIAGTLGLGAAQIDIGQPFSIAAAIAGIFMIALGLHVTGWWKTLTQLESWGSALWARIRPLGDRFMTRRTPLAMFGMGLVWGWLPCGLVYSAVVLSLATASPLQGAAFMLAFGLGTLPMLLAVGNATGRIQKLTRFPIFRQTAGAAIMLAGLYTCWGAFLGGGHGHHGGHGTHSAQSLHGGSGPTHFPGVSRT